MDFCFHQIEVASLLSAPPSPVQLKTSGYNKMNQIGKSLKVERRKPHMVFRTRGTTRQWVLWIYLLHLLHPGKGTANWSKHRPNTHPCALPPNFFTRKAAHAKGLERRWQKTKSFGQCPPSIFFFFFNPLNFFWTFVKICWPCLFESNSESSILSH